MRVFWIVVFMGIFMFDFFYRREGSFVDLEGLVFKDEKRRSRGF